MMEIREFKNLRALIHERTGIWLHDGKQVMLASRLGRRLRHHGITSYAQYYELARSVAADSEEMRALINCVTTNKTSFFREPVHFDYLTRTIVPELVAAAERGGTRTIRVWSACCSTGEEPYSIVMTIIDALEASRRGRTAAPVNGLSTGDWKIEVVATDIDTQVLETAGSGVYPSETIATLSSQRQHKYFLRGKDEMEGQVKLKAEVRQRVHFQRLNLQDAQWPLEGKFHVIFFRNALIYFAQPTQDLFLRKMATFLEPQGHLFLGSSEHIPWLRDLLTPLHDTMYQLSGQR